MSLKTRELDCKKTVRKGMRIFLQSNSDVFTVKKDEKTNLQARGSFGDIILQLRE